ncbi:cytochrome c nitrite reductase pentaheme subunit [bacterium BMS3Abin02]|nr:cytochrome c nitrite reductase pentaheme subunit [bacterium BMS3Abin02]GBE20741.1 cytochrome c nitrite reductase pentaheme subunit [bacterium BMS3Bbin01]HDH26809.1 hypothetical protein [Actinomycetota bacterium]HDK44955.1 hypothetical protein [Actinomycetota bacterium]HDL49786.1 hypothetical protein [Actinomycetota bacterium]
MRIGTTTFQKTALVFGGLVALGALALVAGGLSGAHLENRDTFCAACHSQPESAFVTRSLAASPTDLASFHRAKAVRCIDCHSGPGVMGRTSALALGARDAMRYFTGRFTQPAPLTRSIADTQCTKCHAEVANRQNFQNHFHVFLARWQAQSPGAASCVRCHESHISDGDVRIGFLNEARTTQVCQACHSFAGADD